MVEVAALGVRAYGDGLDQTAGGLLKLKKAAEGADKAVAGLTSQTEKTGGAANQQTPPVKNLAKETKALGQEAKTTAGSLSKMGQSQGVVAGSMNAMGGALRKAALQMAAVTAAALGARALVRYADAWSDMQSTIGAATKDMAGAPALMMRMVDVANASYSPLELTAKTYSRNVTVLRELGKSAADAADFTESLNHMLVITATKGERAASVQNALSKAMAVGKLSGDGLETVLAHGGRVADALADELGTVTNGLRDFARQGKITSAVIVAALLGSLQAVRKEAEAMPATVEDGFQRIQTGIQAIVGTFDQAVGGSGAMAGALVMIGDVLANVAQWIFDNGPLIADIFNTVIGTAIAAAAAAVIYLAGSITTTLLLALGTAVKATLAYAVANGAAASAAGLATVAVAKLRVAFVMLSSAIALAGFGALIIGAGYLVGKFMELVSATGSFGAALSLVKDLALEVWDRIKLGFVGLQFQLAAGWQRIKADVVEKLGDMAHNALVNTNTIVGAFIGAKDAIVAAFGALPDAFANIGARAVNALIDKLAAGVGGIVSILNSLPGVEIEPPNFDKWRAIEGEAADLGGKAKAAFDAAMGVDYTGAGAFSDGMAGATADMRAAGDIAAEWSLVIKRAASEPLKSLEAIKSVLAGVKDEAADSATAVHDLGKALDGAGAGGGVAGSANAAADEMRKLGEETEKTKGSLDDFEGGARSAFTSFVTGANSAREALSNLLSSFANVLANRAFDALWSSLPFADGGVFQGGAQVKAYANGGVLQGGSQVTAFADGGVVNGPTLFPMRGNQTGLMGEAGPEAVMPLKRGKNGKLGVQVEGGGGGSTFAPVYNIDARGADMGVVQRIEQGLARIDAQFEGRAVNAFNMGIKRRQIA